MKIQVKIIIFNEILSFKYPPSKTPMNATKFTKTANLNSSPEVKQKNQKHTHLLLQLKQSKHLNRSF